MLRKIAILPLVLFALAGCVTSGGVGTQFASLKSSVGEKFSAVKASFNRDEESLARFSPQAGSGGGVTFEVMDRYTSKDSEYFAVNDDLVEYRVRIRNNSDGTIRIKGASIIGRDGVYTHSAGVTDVMSTPYNPGNQVAMTAGTTVIGTFVPGTATAATALNVGSSLHSSSKNIVSAKEQREFDERSLPLLMQLAPGATTVRSIFFHKNAAPRSFVLRWSRNGAEATTQTASL